MSARWVAASGSRGQALTELAVFGSLMLLLFGFLLNNALNYDYRQQASMEAFRRGLASAAGTSLTDAPVSISHLLIQDRHIPSPADPFATGTVMPMTAQGGVTRKYNLQNVPADDDSLPRLDIRIENSDCPGPDETCSYTLAGFRTEFDVPQGSLERYRLIYGAQNVCDAPECGGGNGACLQEATDENPETGLIETVCIEFAKIVQITDSCWGQIIGRDDCVRQSAQIVDSLACEEGCQKGGRAASNCEEVCSQPMNVPPYAEGTTRSGGRWVAPRIEALFAGITTMGVQPGSTQVVATDHALNKQESPSAVVSTTRIGLTATTTREIVTTGAPDTVTATKQEGSTTTWTAPW